MKDFISSYERMTKFSPKPVKWWKEAIWAGALAALLYVLAIGMMAM